MPYVHRVRVINIPKTIRANLEYAKKIWDGAPLCPLSASEQNFALGAISYLGSAHGVLSICYVHNFVAEG